MDNNKSNNNKNKIQLTNQPTKQINKQKNIFFYSEKRGLERSEKIEESNCWWNIP